MKQSVHVVIILTLSLLFTGCDSLDRAEYKYDSLAEDYLLTGQLITTSLIQLTFTWDAQPQVYPISQSFIDGIFRNNGGRYEFDADASLFHTRIRLPSGPSQGAVYNQGTSNFEFQITLRNPYPGQGDYRLDSGYAFTCTLTEWNPSTKRALLNFSGQLRNGGDYITISGGVLTSRIE